MAQKIEGKSLEERIRQRAHHIWEREGRPEGRAADHWDMAREEIAIEDLQATATKPNPMTTGVPPEQEEPVEPLAAVENQGEQPNLTDQGEEQQYPSPPWRADRTPPAGADDGRVPGPGEGR